MIASVFGIFPPSGWWALLGVFVLGTFILLLVYRCTYEHTLTRDLFRDVGIAFIVAGLVSAIYEISTRSVAKHETVLASINSAMSEFVPDSVWNEVKQQVLYRRALRRNVQIELKIRHVAELPPGRAVLWMSYSYDLEALAAADMPLTIEHELDYFMRDEKLNLPRFDRVLVVGPGAQIERLYEGDGLKRIYDGKGSIKLQGADSVRVPPRDSGRRIRIITERYEIVNVPGYYYLVMRELTAKEANGSQPTVKVMITEIPSDIAAEVATYYEPHNFTVADKSKTVWTLDGTLLPGQGLTVILTPRATAR